MDQDATWYREVGLDTGDIVLHGDPAPPRKGAAAQQPPLFGPLRSGTVARLNSFYSMCMLSLCFRLV